MGDTCPSGNNLPYEGLLAPVYYFYQAPVTLIENIATAVTPVMVAMGDAWPVLPVLAAVLMYQAQVQMNVMEKLLSYYSLSWILTYMILSMASSREIEGLAGSWDLIVSAQGSFLDSIDRTIALIISGPLLAEFILSMMAVALFGCKNISYLLSMWALSSLYAMANQGVAKGLLMWLNGSMFYIGYTNYYPWIYSP